MDGDISLAASLRPSPVARHQGTLGAYLAECRFEFLRMARAPAFTVPTLLIPLMIFGVFGVVAPPAGDSEAARSVLASCIVLGVMSPGLFGFGASVAIERSQGLLILKKALPMPPGAYLLAKMVMAVAFAGLTTAILIAVAQIFSATHLSLVECAAIVLVNALGVAPFCAIGLSVGSVAPPYAAIPLLQFIYLPLGFLSGLMLPIEAMPDSLAAVAVWLPPYQLLHLNWTAMDLQGVAGVVKPLGLLAAYTAVCFYIAKLGMNRATSA